MPDHSTIKLTPAVTQLQLTAQPSSSVSRGVGRDVHGRNPQTATTQIPLALNPLPDANRGPGLIHNPPYYIYQFSNSNTSSLPKASFDEAVVDEGLRQLGNFNLTFIFSREFICFSRELISLAKDFFIAQENKELKAIVLLLLVAVLTMIRFLHRDVSTRSCLFIILHSGKSQPQAIFCSLFNNTSPGVCRCHRTLWGRLGVKVSNHLLLIQWSLRMDM